MVFDNHISQIYVIIVMTYEKRNKYSMCCARTEDKYYETNWKKIISILKYGNMARVKLFKFSHGSIKSDFKI